MSTPPKTIGEKIDTRLSLPYKKRWVIFKSLIILITSFVRLQPNFLKSPFICVFTVTVSITDSPFERMMTQKPEVTAVDLSGRGMLCYDLQVPTQKVGTFDTELVEEFLIALARRGDISIHVRQLAGNNSHHIIEGAFKSLARSLAAAASVDPRFSQEIPSTKGVL